MSWIQGPIRKHITSLVAKRRPPAADHHFICFSNEAIYGTDLAEIQYYGGSTEIEEGFKLLQSKVGRTSLYAAKYAARYAAGAPLLLFKAHKERVWCIACIVLVLAAV